MANRNYIWIGLITIFAACSDEQTENISLNASKYEVTGKIRNLETSTRILDANLRNTFQTGDAILISWDGGETYNYTYSSGTGKFAANAGESSIWTALSSVSTPTIDVYSWYGKASGGKLPVTGETVSVPADQASEGQFLSALYMTAHQRISPQDVSLNFVFEHLMARVTLSVNIIDPLVEQNGVMNATARLEDTRTDSKLGIDADANHVLGVPDVETRENIEMCRSWSDQQPFSAQFKCLFPPQTLSKDKRIVITLGNGKEYVCFLSKDITLKGGQNAALTASLKASENAVLKPVITVIPNAVSSTYSGNRIFSSVLKDDGTYCLRVYDKQADGSWGTGEIVYEDENGITEFPYGSYSAYKAKEIASIDLFSDYGACGFNLQYTGNHTFFIKKSTRTGKWYCAAGKLNFPGYAVAISQDFLITGVHVGESDGSNTYVYPIDADGNLDPAKGYKRTGMSGYKLSIAGNVLATNTGVFQYNGNTNQWDFLFNSTFGKTQRVATDGKRVIFQNGGNISEVKIYDIETKKEEAWKGTVAKAGVGRPIAIYEDYALAGGAAEDNPSGKDWLDICYRNPDTGLWEIINPDGGFLEMMKHWNPGITLTNLNGNLIFLKGTRAMISSKAATTYFVENIDEMVKDWLANPY